MPKHALTTALARAGTSVQSTAEELGVSPLYLYGIAAGEFAPSRRVLAGLSAQLGVDESAVVDLCPTKPGRKPFPPCREAVSQLAAAGVTRADLARRSGIGPGNVSQYLTGRRMPSKKLMAAVEDATGLPREALFPHLFSGVAK